MKYTIEIRIYNQTGDLVEGLQVPEYIDSKLMALAIANMMIGYAMSKLKEV